MADDATLFGPLLDSSDVERALLTFLQEWCPDYVQYALRNKDPGKKRWPNGIREPRSWRTVHLVKEKWPEEQMPCILAHSPGESREPEITADGTVLRTFGVAVGTIATGGGKNPEQDAKELARLISSALRLAVIQHPDLGCPAYPDGFALDVSMGPESNSEITKGVEAERHLMGVWVPYEIQIPQTADVWAGPDVPSAEPEVEPEPRPHVKKDGASVSVNVVDKLPD